MTRWPTPGPEAHPERERIPPLRVDGRCDQCGAEAFVLIQAVGWLSDLRLCAHHGRSVLAAVPVDDCIQRIDQRDRLNA